MIPETIMIQNIIMWEDTENNLGLRDVKFTGEQAYSIGQNWYEVKIIGPDKAEWSGWVAIDCDSSFEVMFADTRAEIEGEEEDICYVQTDDNDI